MESPLFNNDQQQLEQVFSSLASEFAKADKEVKKYEENLSKRVEAFKSATAKPVDLTLKEDMPITSIFLGIQQAFADYCVSWASEMAQTGRNLSFREKLNDSMLVYVYGKVKSGKSSLGNFVAYGKHDPSPEEIAKRSPVEFDVEAVQDNENAAERQKIEQQRKSTREEHRFLVDFMEATACIQFFRKPGLTWIDSPGIHSLTTANGELAKKYLGSADLVVYTTTGHSAMQEADRKELLEIVRSKKPYIVVITRCDEWDEDIDASGNEVTTLKMLTDKERNEIKEWSVTSLDKELQDNGLSHSNDEMARNTITVSCKYAEEHAEDDGWINSGIPYLFQKLRDIAKSDGVQMKLDVPINAMLHHIGTMQSGTLTLGKKLDEAKMQLDVLRNKISRQIEQESYRATTLISKKINELANNLYGNDERFKQSSIKAAEDIIAEALERVASNIVQDTINMTKNMPIHIQAADFQRFEDITQEVSYKSTQKSKYGTGLGALIGGGIGFFLGGPAGAALGAGIGSTVGGLGGRALDDDVSSTVRVGDNRLDVARDTSDKIKEAVQQVFSDMQRHFEKQCILPLLAWLEGLDAQSKAWAQFLTDTKAKVEGERTK